MVLIIKLWEFLWNNKGKYLGIEFVYEEWEIT